MLRRNILIFHSGALGDSVLSWPLAMALARIHPQSRIIYVTRSQKGALAAEAIGIEWADVESGWHHLFGESAALPEKPAKMLAGAQAIYTFVADRGDRWCENVRRLSGVEPVCLMTRPPADFGAHAAEFLVHQLSDHRAVAEGTRQMLASIASNGIGKPPAANGGILIHPGSGSDAKCWPLGRFVELARRLMEDGKSVRFVMGEREMEQWPAGRVAECQRVAEVVQSRTLVELYKLLRSGDGFIGNDSGPGHLAGVLGLRTMILYGPTNPAVWRPLGPRVRAIGNSPLDGIAVDRVLAEMNGDEEW